MFDFFEGLIENLGIKLISDFSNKLIDFIKAVKENNTVDNGDLDKDFAQIGSSGNYAQIGSSGHGAQIGSSGRYAKIGSSGDRAQIGSSGDKAQIGSSGDCSKIGSSGVFAQISSSGNGTQIGSSGDFAQIGSSGVFAQIGSSGNGAQIGSSGDRAKIGSNGDRAEIGSSGNYAKIDVNGDNSIGFACGINSIIKAKQGTWISLAEYGRNVDNKIIPIYAKSAQIGNKDYTDYKGQELEENVYYILWKKEFYPVAEYDGIWTIILSEKNRENIKIIKAVYINDLFNKEIKEIYIAQEGKLSAHGYTIREAVEDLTFKKMKNVNVDEIVAEIKKTGKVTRSQYRAITGACSFGTEQFCKQHKIQDLEEIELEKLRKILINDYGAEKFWELIDKE